MTLFTLNETTADFHLCALCSMNSSACITLNQEVRMQIWNCRPKIQSARPQWSFVCSSLNSNTKEPNCHQHTGEFLSKWHSWFNQIHTELLIMCVFCVRLGTTERSVSTNGASCPWLRVTAGNYSHPPQGGVHPPKFSGHCSRSDPTRGVKHCVHCNSTLSWPASAANEIWLAAVLCTHASATLHRHLAAAAGVTQGLQALQ